jgi:hypothetical protein
MFCREECSVQSTCDELSALMAIAFKGVANAWVQVVSGFMRAMGSSEIPGETAQTSITPSSFPWRRSRRNEDAVGSRCRASEVRAAGDSGR